jgi:hypothetical protein
MALVIEDGSGVAGATSYVTLTEARAYAAARGLTLPSGDPALEQLLTKGTDYLEGLRGRFKGNKANGSGYLQWPRTNADGTGIDVDGYTVDPTTIPSELKLAQCQLAVELQTQDPTPTTSGPAVRQETIGPITTVYAVGDNAGNPLPVMPKVEALLAPLFSSSWGRVSTTRV